MEFFGSGASGIAISFQTTESFASDKSPSASARYFFCNFPSSLCFCNLAAATWFLAKVKSRRSLYPDVQWTECVLPHFFTKIGCEQVRNAVDNGFRMGASPYQLACLLQVNPGLHKGSEVSGVLIRLPALVFRNPIIVFFLVL